MQDLIHRLIAATNAFDVKAALEAFAPDAVIDDVSVGQTFAGSAGVRRYLEQFFVGYHTVSKVLSIDSHGENQALVRLDFSGDFGQETGRLDVTTNADGLIAAIDADLD